MRIAKTFSFTDEENDILDHIEKQPNMSQYIKDLVRADMNNQSKDIEALVRQYVEKYLGEQKKGQ